MTGFSQRSTPDDPEPPPQGSLPDGLQRLEALAPESFSESRGDFEAEESREKYGLGWRGKCRARQLSLARSTGTLRPCPEDSEAWDTTQNLMIEGDNLEVLKLLQKSYSSKIKLVFIDPPYNTGNDFVYPDDYRDNVRNYLELTGQIDGTGRKLSSNPDASGRFHTAWLNLMYPRLLTRHLLKSDGILLIAIDDHEVHHLRSLCDEVFGSENYCGTFVWEKKKKPSFLDRNMGSVTDYIVAYAKNRTLAPPFIAGSVESGKKYPFNNAGNPVGVLSFPPRSVTFSCPDQWVRAQDMSEGNIITELLDDVRIQNGVNADRFRLRGEWRYSQAKLDEFVNAGAAITVSKIPFRPNYVNRSGEAKKTSNLLSHRVNGVPTNEDATREMRELFGADVMSYPKPTGLIQYLVRATTGENDIILDYFAGSGTTAGGVLRQSLADGLPRRYLLVQLPELLDPQNREQEAAAKVLDAARKPRNLAELTKEYLRRTAESIRDHNPQYPGDLGFRAFKLDSSNFSKRKLNPTELEASLSRNLDNLKPDRTAEDVLFELLLEMGLDLGAAIEKRSAAGQHVYAVAGGALLACLGSSISASDAASLGTQIASWKNERSVSGDTTCVFRDSAFENDVAKLNLTSFLFDRGIASVRCV